MTIGDERRKSAGKNFTKRQHIVMCRWLFKNLFKCSSAVVITTTIAIIAVSYRKKRTYLIFRCGYYWVCNCSSCLFLENSRVTAYILHRGVRVYTILISTNYCMSPLVEEDLEIPCCVELDMLSTIKNRELVEKICRHTILHTFIPHCGFFSLISKLKKKKRNKKH